MKTPFIFFLLLNISLSAQGPWTQKSSLPAVGRHRCVTFSVGNRGYMGCGWNGVTMYNDFWEYDPGSDTWMQKQNYPGGARLSAFGFSIGNKGYAGCGLDQNLYVQSDFYEYNPATNVWTPKSSFIGTPVFGASTCTINNKGYMVCGDDWDLGYWRHNEMYRYDPSTNSWAYVTAMPADGRRDPVGFAINNKFYVGTGGDNSYMETNDWWEYDPATGLWTQKAMMPGLPRSQAVGWSVSGKGYLGTGGVADLNDFWQYDPVANSWQQVNDFPGQGRENAQSFVIGNKGYLVCGTSGVNYADIWEFDPLHIVGIDETKQNEIRVFPSIVDDEFHIEMNEDGTHSIEVFDITGKCVLSSTFEGVLFTAQRNGIAPGTYLLYADRSSAHPLNGKIIFR